MADKAEKDLDQASDCGWVRALDANGNPIKIAKADLVELIRANMPVVSEGIKGLLNYEHLLAYKGDIPDCNKANHGIYRVLDDAANMPVVVISAAIVISLVCYFNESYKFQLFFNLSSGNQLFWRMKVDEYWAAWSAL